MTVIATTSTSTSSAASTALVRRPRKPRRWLRTRDREQLLQLNLQLDVNNLHSEIRALRVTRSLLQSRILNRHCDRDGSYVKMVHEYFSKLRHGYRYPQLTQRNHQDGNDQEEVMMISARRFLDVLFDPLVQKGHLRGVELCIQMIAKYTEAFGPVVHELLSAQIQADPHATTESTESDGEEGSRTVLVRAKTRYRTTIVPKTFEIIFPFAGQECREKLMHKTLEGTGQFDIVFDTTTHRVVRFDIQFDFVPAFARVESDPRILGQLFSRALVASDCCIGDKGQPKPKTAVTTSGSPLPLRVETTVETCTDVASATGLATGNTTPVKEEAAAATPSAPSPNSRYKVMDIRSLLNADTTE